MKKEAKRNSEVCDGSREKRKKIYGEKKKRFIKGHSILYRTHTHTRVHTQTHTHTRYDHAVVQKSEKNNQGTTVGEFFLFVGGSENLVSSKYWQIPRVVLFRNRSSLIQSYSKVPKGFPTHKNRREDDEEDENNQ